MIPGANDIPTGVGSNGMEKQVVAGIIFKPGLDNTSLGFYYWEANNRKPDGMLMIFFLIVDPPFSGHSEKIILSD